MAFSFLTNLLILVCSLTAVVHAQAIAQLFSVDSSCNGIDLDGMLNDARTMLGSAQTAITTIKAATRFPGSSTTRYYMRNAHNSFGITYQPASVAVIGKQYPLDADDIDTVTTASTNLGQIQSLLALGQERNAQLGPANAYISCSDVNYVKTTNAQDIDPSLPAGTTTSSEYAADYLWYIPGNAAPFVDATGRQRRVIRNKPGQEAGLCAEGYIATTETPNLFQGGQPLAQIVICPNFFNRETRAGFKNTGYQQSLAAVTPQPESTTNNILYPTYQFTGSAFVHEMFHVLSPNGFGDTPIYKFQGQATGTPYPPYGANLLFAVANNPDGFCSAFATSTGGTVDLLSLPDAYRTFLDACSFPSVKWEYNKNALNQATGANADRHTKRSKGRAGIIWEA